MMGATAAAVSEFFAADATATAAVATADTVYAGATTAEGLAAAAAVPAATVPSALGTIGSAALKTGAQALAIGGAQKLLAPTPTAPSVKPVTEMPDPLAQEAARKQSLLEQLARRGRQSTILTDAGNGKLGG